VSYIDKNSNIVVSARLTQSGRELLSTGLLNFSTFKVGDSEIDYTTLGAGYDITLSNVMKAVANQPEFKTFILPNGSSTTESSTLPTLNPIILNTVLQSPEIGFFTSGTTLGDLSYTMRITTDYVLQPNVVIPLSGALGTNSVPLKQSSSYATSGNTYEPTNGDLILVKMSNDTISGQTSGVVDETLPVPYLWYQISNVTGTLSADTMVVELDRNFADFSSVVTSNECQVTVYPYGNQFTEGGLYDQGEVWNQNNVWSNNIPGVDTGTYKGFTDYTSKNYVGSKEYYGYTSEITEATDFKDSISLIHYSNVQSCDNQTELKYGQKFYIDTDNDEAPILKMPTLMWHKDDGTTMGHTFTVSGDVTNSYVTLGGNNTQVSYYNMIDGFGNSVGRVFPQYNMFSIDDQELVAAMSYKSNRNWTLPKLNWDILSSADGVIDQTETLYVTYVLASNSGYTTGMHSQNISSADFSLVDGCEDCLPTTAKAVTVNFPPDELPFMNTSGTTGWYADTLYMLVQKVVKDTNGIPQKPNAASWLSIDVTSSIDSHTVGQRIEPNNLENTTFTITQTLYGTGTAYSLHDFINIPTTAESLLNFGDEQFFYGGLTTKNITTKYRTKFDLTLPPTSFNISTNPTWANSGQNVHISEVGIYNSTNNLVAVGKMNLPIEKAPNTTIIVEMAFDL
jgi:hypothetical protein